MSDTPRFLPHGKFLAEITQRCVSGRYLLQPSEQLNLLIAGVLGKALEKYPIELVDAAFLSNHYHLMVTGTSQKDLSAFMNFVSGNIAQEAGRLHRWKGKVWERRYRCIPITDEEEIQVARLKYLLSQGCKEGLVASPRQWPGLNCAKELMTGRGLRGKWIDRTALSHVRRRKKDRDRIRAIDFEEEVFVKLSPLPCWAHLSPEEYQQRVRDLVEEIEQETAARHRRENTRPVGRRAVLRQDPLFRPKSLKKSLAPRVHAATRAARKGFLNALRIFVQAYRSASAEYRMGKLETKFPEGCFRPAGPFVEPRGAPA